MKPRMDENGNRLKRNEISSNATFKGEKPTQEENEAILMKKLADLDRSHRKKIEKTIEKTLADFNYTRNASARATNNLTRAGGSGGSGGNDDSSSSDGGSDDGNNDDENSVDESKAIGCIDIFVSLMTSILLLLICIKHFTLIIGMIWKPKLFGSLL